MTTLARLARLAAGLALLATLPGPARADHPSIGLGVGAAAPVTTISALPLPKGSLTMGLEGEYVDLDRYSDGRLDALADADPDSDFHSVESLFSISLSAAYGVTDDLMVGLRLPYIHRRDVREPDHAGGGGIESLGDPDGVGDLSFYGQYRFLHNPGRDLHAALIAGLKTPTGETDEETPDGARVETEFQPGSGSWDPFLGLAVSRHWGGLSVDASLLYTRATEGSQDTDLGDSAAYNLAVSYRLTAGGASHPHHAGHGHVPHTDHGHWDLIAELNGEWRDKEEVDGESDGNSGGNLLYLSPGVRYLSPHGWALSVSVGVPIWEDLNGDQVEPEYRVITSLGMTF